MSVFRKLMGLLLIYGYFSLGLSQAQPQTESLNIIVIGETGKGKTTFINAIYNFLIGRSVKNLKFIVPLNPGTEDEVPSVKHYLENDARVKKNVYGQIEKENDTKQLGLSDTTAIVGYELTTRAGQFELIDTPGLNDTSGHEASIAIVNQIKQFLFDFPDKLNMIVLVVDSGMNRTSETCLQMFNQIKSMFPPEVSDHFLVMINFSSQQACTHPSLIKICRQYLSADLKEEQFKHINLAYLADYNTLIDHYRSFSAYVNPFNTQLKALENGYEQDKNFSEQAIVQLLDTAREKNKLVIVLYTQCCQAHALALTLIETAVRMQLEYDTYTPKIKDAQEKKASIQVCINAINPWTYETYSTTGSYRVTDYRIETVNKIERVPYQVRVRMRKDNFIGTGATAGAAIGTAFLPGIGTAIGGFFGALVGGNIDDSDYGYETRYREVTVPVKKSVPYQRTVSFPTTKTRKVEDKGKKQQLVAEQKKLNALCCSLEALEKAQSVCYHQQQGAIAKAKQQVQFLSASPYELQDFETAFAERWPQLHDTTEKCEAAHQVILIILGGHSS